MHLMFIGAGNMATAIARGIRRTEALAPEDMSAVDVSSTARDAFHEATGISTKAEPDGACNADILLLAVKPQQIQDVLQQLPLPKNDQLVVSIAAGIRLESLAEEIGHHRIIRVMPNTPMSIGEGVIAFSSDRDVSADDKVWVRTLFDPVGLVREVREESMDTVTALSGSGPAYVFEFIRCLAEAGVAEGLPKDLSQELAAQTVVGAAEMARSGEGPPAKLRDDVTSKGGTTEAGLAMLKQHDLGDLLKQTVAAAKQRSQELGQGG